MSHLKKKVSYETVAASKETTANRFISPVLLYTKATSMILSKKKEDDNISSD